MKNLSRRKENLREVWPEDKRSAEDALLIPPHELWHDNKNTSLEKKEEKKLTETVKSDGIKPVSSQSQCWAFMGAIGGVGTTTLAVQMAYELAKKQARIDGQSRRIIDPQVCLVDLDFESGSCIHHLDVEPGLTLDDLSGDALRIDTSITEAFLSPHASGISVLAAPNMIGANSHVKTQTVLALLDAVSDMFPYLILDMPRQWQPWSPAAVAGSDFVGLLSDLTIPSLHMARTKKEQIDELFQDESRCEVILNKYERRSFKNTLQLSDAKIALKCDLFGKLCEDSSVTQAAINCGEPAGAIKASSRYAKDNRKLFEQIVALVSKKSQNKNEIVSVAS